ncbi:MAG: DUF885 domain-containing protein [Candidatus Marinimicrobia bacterium]|nr:DUF885 domain-containing protein [Candidatus Neomarinimicrobiota bacterium]
MNERNGLIIFLIIAAVMTWLSPGRPTKDSSKNNESKKANAYFEKVFQEKLDHSPEFKMRLGIKEDQGHWDDNSERESKISLARTERQLRWLKNNIDYDKLVDQTKLSYDLFVYEHERTIAKYKYRYHNYPLNQMHGIQSGVPADLISMHKVDNVQDALNYISRLRRTQMLFKHVLIGLEIRRTMGIIPPEFVFPHVVRDCQNIISNEPFENTGIPSTLLEDFTKKVNALDISTRKRDRLLIQAKQALLKNVKPAYNDLIAYFKKLQPEASEHDGVWSLPQGEAFYNSRLAYTTTTDLTAKEIHQIGLSEVDRIHAEMRTIMKKVGFEGTLQQFFKHINDDDSHFYEDSDQGRADYVADATRIVDDMRVELDQLFITKPKAELVVKPVEAFREKSAGKAFYQSPTLDGSRPGTYYVNTYDLKAIPKYQMEALAYHEGIPGHHMQIAISQELKDIPMFRKFGWYTAYGEGWALYSEYIPKEMGFYSDPYSDFGRLAMELWRACRLVVDTGIHAKRWTREQGIEYYVNNTPNVEADAVKMVERHIVMAGQATGYKIGMLKILELRERAKKQLGDTFDIREYHDIVLTNGRLPLNILEDQVDKWIASKLN